MRPARAVAVAVLTAAVSMPLTGTASAVDLDCADFPNQAAAQVVLDGDPADPNGLDSNANGVACESYGYTAVAAPTAGQVAVRPEGGVAAGDGSSAGRTTSEEGSPLPYVVGGLAFAAAGGAAVAARRAARA
jgi:hypothetical protein